VFAHSCKLGLEGIVLKISRPSDQISRLARRLCFSPAASAPRACRRSLEFPARPLPPPLPRSSTEFDSIVPVEYRAESQVLRFACQRRALLTTSIRRQQRTSGGGLDAESNIRYFCCSHCSGYNFTGGSFACASPPGASSYYFGYGRKSHPKGRQHLSPLVAMARSSLGPNLLARWLRPMLERSWLQPSYPAVPVLAPLGMAVQ
jgi:hypothetical protein